MSVSVKCILVRASDETYDVKLAAWQYTPDSVIGRARAYSNRPAPIKANQSKRLYGGLQCLRKVRCVLSGSKTLHFANRGKFKKFIAVSTDLEVESNGY
jgi:hypothetical protein